MGEDVKASTQESSQSVPDFSNWSCPLPLADYPTIVMGHGGGGKLGNELVEHLFLPAFRNPELENLGDAAVLDSGRRARLAMSTDSFVVQPLFFPGGSIGELAVNGTVNDLAVSGAEPRFLSASFILEEGFPLAQLAAIVDDMAKAAAMAGVKIVTGDTKVVERGHGDGCYINTAGVGALRPGIQVGPHRAQAGDAILVSGTIGDHGMAIMSVREGLEFESQIRSDCAALNGLIAEVLAAAGAAVHTMRDPTRGGLASTLNEIAQSSGVGIEIDEASLPVRLEVQSACELLGLDPVYVANEGKVVFFVAPEAAEQVLAVLRAHPLGARRCAHRPRDGRAQGHAGGAHGDGRQSRDSHADWRAVAAHLLRARSIRTVSQESPLRPPKRRNGDGLPQLKFGREAHDRSRHVHAFRLPISILTVPMSSDGAFCNRSQSSRSKAWRTRSERSAGSVWAFELSSRTMAGGSGSAFIRCLWRFSRFLSRMKTHTSPPVPARRSIANYETPSWTIWA